MVFTPRRLNLLAWAGVTRGSTVMGEDSEWSVSGSRSLRRDGRDGTEETALRFWAGVLFTGVSGPESNSFRVSSIHLFLWALVMLA